MDIAPAFRLTSQSKSLACRQTGGQGARLEDVWLWRWHAPSGLRKPILEAIDWRIGAGEHWALLGPNGAGKTTLLTVAAAVEFPSRGSVELLGRRLGRTDVRRLREAIGFVDARLGARFAPRLTLEQVVLTGATGTIGLFEERLASSDRERVRALLESFAVSHLAGRRFGDCSHGERKRALIARALACGPRLLLLDEPGAGLDLPGRETLLSALARLAGEQPDLPVVTTTHHLEELPASTSHALLLREGRIVAAGPAEEVLADGPLSACFGLQVSVRRENGRWSATAP
jgi:iron complex transport system ATP-binding protein